MKISARVVTADGAPLARGQVEVVGVEQVLARGVVKEGTLAVTVSDTMPPVWGLMIEGQPVIAFPAAADKESIDLGDLVLDPKGIPFPAFHAKQGVVFGIPKARLETGSGGEATPTKPEPGTELPGMQTIDFQKPVPFRTLLDSTAKQFANVAESSGRVKLTGATVTMRGLPSGSGNDLSLEFPSADLAKNANGLSELSFGLRPDVSGPVQPQVPAGPILSDLSGYTRELALRKLASAGLTATLASEVVADARAVGRIVRQLPVAGQSANPIVPVQLFIGKAGGPP